MAIIDYIKAIPKMFRNTHELIESHESKEQNKEGLNKIKEDYLKCLKKGMNIRSIVYLNKPLYEIDLEDFEMHPFLYIVGGYIPHAITEDNYLVMI